MKKHYFRLSMFAGILAIVMTVFSCSRNPVTGKKQLNFMSEQKEKALGMQSDPGIVASFGLYENPTIQKFINEKGQKMAKVSHRPNLGFEFKVLDSPVVNAFALPGGYVYFTRGILAHFNNEAEFAGVLGHEIGHVTARHSAQQYTKQMIGQVGFIAGMIFSPTLRQFGNELQQGMGLLFLKFGRDHESQSDRLGVEYSTKIGYDAKHMANFFRTLNRLSDAGGGRIPTFMSTHPDPLDRYNKVGALADKWQKNLDKSKLKVNRNQYLRMIDGLIYGEDPRQGYVEDDRFYHPEMKFTFPIPRGWKTANSPQAFQMASKDQKAMMTLTLAAEKTLDGAAQKFVQDNKLTLTSSQKGKTQTGLPAIALFAQQTGQQTQQGQQAKVIKVIAYFIEYNGIIYKFYGLSLDADFRIYKNIMENSMDYFGELRDQSKMNVKPKRIKVISVSRNETFGNAISAYTKTTKEKNELAILNSMELNTPVKAGMLIKVITK